MSKFTIVISQQEEEHMVRGALSEDVRRFAAFVEQQNFKHDKYVGEFSDNFNRGEMPYFQGQLDDREEWVGRTVSNIHEDEEDIIQHFTDDYSNYLYKSQLLMLWALQEKSLKEITERLATIRREKKPKCKKVINEINDFYSTDNIKNASTFHYEIFLLHKYFSDKEAPTHVMNHIRYLLDVNKIRNNIVHNSETNDEVVNRIIGIEKNSRSLILSSRLISDVCWSLDQISC